jgi:ubiquinone/menaquinone biosynthesis C-methylase UbiE
MKYTGERIIPKITGTEGHKTLYEKGLKYVENKFVLDIASGAGWGTELLATKAQYVIGADISQESVIYAKKEYPQNKFSYCLGDILNIPFPDGIFDVVNSIETIEHVKRSQITTLLSECHPIMINILISRKMNLNIVGIIFGTILKGNYMIY